MLLRHGHNYRMGDARWLHRPKHRQEPNLEMILHLFINGAQLVLADPVSSLLSSNRTWMADRWIHDADNSADALCPSKKTWNAQSGWGKC